LKSLSFPLVLVVVVSILWACGVSAPLSGEGASESTLRPGLLPSLPADEKAKTFPYPPWWGTPPPFEEGVPCREPGTCVKCHDNQSRMDPSHAFACVECHGGDPRTDEEEKAHAGIIADPGDLKTVEKTCGKCHPDQVLRVRLSPMALAPRMISHTRFGFGAQKDSVPKYATVPVARLEQVPHPTRSSNLGDDLLRRSCLRCHLYSRGSERSGEHRGLGCSACHIARANTEERKTGPHRLVRAAGITACLKCHNSNHVGADYVGLFEKDSHRGFRSPFVEGRHAPRIYGSEQHRLAADVHFRVGMECMDCHTIEEVHGSGNAPESPYNNVQTTCESCHVRGDHPAVMREKNGEMKLVRGQGRTVPAWNPDLIPHKIPEHGRVRCSACHAAWSFQDYGFHLMLEERADYWKWAPTAAQNDPQVQQLLERHVGSYVELVEPRRGPVPEKPETQWQLPTMSDWLSGEVRSGAWFRGYTARRWADPPLGLDHRGKVSVMRPIHQYVVSQVDKRENLLLDRQIPSTGSGKPALIFNPYEPHTTAGRGRNCHECHGNPKAVGLGEGVFGIGKPGFNPVWKAEDKIPGHSFRWDALVDKEGRALQSSSHPSGGPLDAKTIKKLLNPSNRQRAYQHKYLQGKPR